MTNQKILEKAIEKAVGNGWKPLNRGAPTSIQQWRDKGMVEIGTVYPERDDDITWVRELEGIIFNHDFAKALWGKYDVMPEADYKFSRDEGDGAIKSYFFVVAPNIVHTWQYHLQMMVVDPDPVAYLGRNI